MPWALSLLMLCLPLGTATLEVATAIVALWALPHLRHPSARARLRDSGLLPPTLAITGLALLAGLGRDPGWPRDALGVLWSLAPAILLPLLPPAASPWPARLGQLSAALVGSGAVLWALAQGAHGWPAAGPFSHHLTLGYALLPPLGAALCQRRLLLAGSMAAGVLATASLGPLLGLLVVSLGASTRRPLAALLGGVALALAILPLLIGQEDLYERAVLWASGAAVTLNAPLGTGSAPSAFRLPLATAQDTLSPGFHFPLHAHDAALQIGVEVGVAGWIAWAWLCMALWRRATPGGQAGLAAVVVIGGLTQDTLGDLEVLRATLAWALLSEPSPDADVQDRQTPAPDTSPP